MTFEEILDQALAMLQRRRRVTYSNNQPCDLVSQLHFKRDTLLKRDMEIFLTIS